MSLFNGALALATLLAAATCCPIYAQDPPQTPTSPDPRPATPAPAPKAALPQAVKPPDDPKILEDGGLSIEPIYWFNHAQPKLKGGKQATAYDNFDYQGNAKAAYGAELGIPAGRANTLRFSYFRLQGSSNTTLTQDATYFSENYNAGDFLVGTYTIQSAKISWDYLSYTWYGKKIKFKTLYEVQYVGISSSQYAPLKAETTDASGNTDTNSDAGSKNLFLPTFGVEFEQPIGRHLRWEAKASGFGIPKHAVIWDAQADLAIRVGALELIAGGKAFHFKTSPSGTEYFYDTLQGAFVGVRYYVGQQRR